MKRIAAALCVLFLLGLAAFAQAPQEGEEDNGFFLNLLEDRLSTPSRRIRLQGVSGALSSQAEVELITISDTEGEWLRIENAVIDWSRRALLRGRVEVSLLAADRIAILRRPVPAPAEPGLPQVEAQPFSLPELPVAVQLEALRIDELSFAEEVLGQAATLQVTGSLTLAGGALDTELAIVRQDGPGGRLELAASYANETRQLAVDLTLQEPSGGIVASLLNVEGEPAIDLSLQGSGPLDDVELAFALDADGARIAGGTVALDRTEAGLGFTADITGGLAPLLPEQYRDFFQGESAVRVAGVNKTEGGVRLDRLAVEGAALDLQGTLETGADGFLRSVDLEGRLGEPGGEPVVLPVPGGATTLQSAELSVQYGEANRWTGLLALDQLTAGDIAFADMRLDMGGLARNLEDPATREVTINLEGVASGITAADPDVAAALGDRIDFFLDAALPPQAPIEVNQLQISGNGLSIFTAGTLEDWTYDGRFAVRAADIAPFSGFAGRDLGGAVNLRAQGSVSPLSGGFDLTLDGSTTDLVLDDPRLDGLLAGETTLSGRAVRDESGIRTEELQVENPQLAFSSTGRISSAATDIRFDARLEQLSLLDPRLSGALTASGTAVGAGGPIDVALEAAIPEGRLMERSLTQTQVSFDGTVQGADVTGSVRGSGRLDDQPMTLSGELRASQGVRAVEDLVLEVGPDRLAGSVTQIEGEPLRGTLTLDAPDIAPLAALALAEATGAVNAEIVLEPAEAGQGVVLTARAQDLAFGSTRVGALDADARVSDAFGVPLVQGTLSARDLVAGGVAVETLSARADQRSGTEMDFSADATLAIGTEIDVAGGLVRLPDGFSATLERLRLQQEGMDARLREASTVTLRGGAIDITPLTLDLGGGSLRAMGRVDEAYDLSVELSSVPLALANAIRPDIDLAGVLDGTTRVTGPRSAPAIAFDVSGTDVAAAATRAAGLPPVSVEATGTTSDRRLSVDATVAGAGLSARATGAIPLGEGAIDLAVVLESFPLALVDPLAGNRGIAGALTGEAQVAGTVAAPEATFDLRAADLTAQILRENGIAPLQVSAQGAFADRALVLDAVALSNAGGLAIDARGTVPLAGTGLDLALDGRVPLSLADPFLAERDAQAAGQLTVEARATGALADPNIAGDVSLAGGTIVDPRTNLRLEDIVLDAGFEGNALVIRSLRADSSAGGGLAVQGRIALDPAQRFPADLTARIQDLRYTDGAMIATRLSGTLALTGPLVGSGGTLSGALALGETEISVNEALGGGAQARLEQVIHRLPPPRVQQTLARADLDARPEPPESPSGPGLGLDLRISAPNQIFVRGRGLDVELGGALTLRGTLDDLQPVGQFDLRRGRLAILGQRIEFDEGSLQLIGDFRPRVNFVARTESGDVTAIVTVTGPVSEPDISFSSQPELPEDEVLARVIFNRGTEDLSAFQLAQLAAAAAELAGRGGNGLFSQLREAAGLDDLDIVTEDDGSTAVRAGKYINENVYLDVQTGSDGTSRAQVNLDITDEVTARGSVATDGNTALGLFYERDY